tara:strand:+ start:17072 stop:17248 length:177 start_codon:yes stop_codon:yes gene_type:complete
MTDRTIPDIKNSTTETVWTLMEDILELETDYKDRIKLTTEDNNKICDQILRLLDESIK